MKLWYFPNFFAVLRYLLNFFAVMQCSATSNVPLNLRLSGIFCNNSLCSRRSSCTQFWINQLKVDKRGWKTQCPCEKTLWNTENSCTKSHLFLSCFMQPGPEQKSTSTLSKHSIPFYNIFEEAGQQRNRDYQLMKIQKSSQGGSWN